MVLSSRLMCLAILVLASHATLSSAAIRVWGLRATGLTGDPGHPPEPYVKVWCGGTSGGRTETIKSTPNPSWSAEFSFLSCGFGQTLVLEVWDEDVTYDDHLGTCRETVTQGTHSPVCTSLSQGIVYFNYSAQ